MDGFCSPFKFAVGPSKGLWQEIASFGRNIKDSQPYSLDEKDCVRYSQQMRPQGIDPGMHTSQL